MPHQRQNLAPQPAHHDHHNQHPYRRTCQPAVQFAALVVMLVEHLYHRTEPPLHRNQALHPLKVVLLERLVMLLPRLKPDTLYPKQIDREPAY